MAWKPKTIAGKILKGAVIGGGSILGLATGVGMVGGVVKRTGVINGVLTSLKGTKTVIDKVGASAVNLVTGTTKEQRETLREVKDEANEAKNQLQYVDKLIAAGATPEKARQLAGIQEDELQALPDGTKINSAGMSGKTLLWIAAGAAALFLLPKLLKR